MTAVSRLFLEAPRHGDCAWVEVSCGQSSDEGNKVGPAHREVAGEDLAEALVKLSLNYSNKGGWNVLLYLCLYSETGVSPPCRFQERCELKH